MVRFPSQTVLNTGYLDERRTEAFSELFALFMGAAEAAFSERIRYAEVTSSDSSKCVLRIATLLLS